MKQIIKFYVIIIFLFIYNQAFSQVRFLKKIDHYPKKNGDYFFQPLIDFQIKDNNLYAVENLSHKILKFSIDKELEHIKFIGMPGRGPGELKLPTGISIWNEEIVVKDSNAFSFFNLDGKFVKEFKTFSSKHEFVFVNGRIFWLNSNPEDNHLIEVYSQEGEKIFDFGNKFSSLNFSLFKGLGPFEVEKIAYSGNLLSDNVYIYYINTTFGKLIKFKLDGSKVLETNIGNLFEHLGKKAIEMNNKIFIEEGLDIRGKGSYRYYLIFIDAYLFENEIYLADPGWTPGEETANEQVNFIVLDKNTLEVNRKYIIKKEKTDHIICFAITKKDNALTFFTSLRRDSRNFVAEYGEEK